MTDNTEQKEFWNDLKGDLWVELQTKIDPMLAVFDENSWRCSMFKKENGHLKSAAAPERPP